MSNKRRYPRYSLDVMEVNGKMAFATDVKIINISLGGIAIKADRRLNLGCEYTLKIEDRRDTLALKGLVIRCSLSEAQKRDGGSIVPIYAAGMQFTDMTSEKSEQLLKFITRNKSSKTDPLPRDRRHDIRFQIRTRETMALQFLDDYKVRKISLGGMLIECRTDLEVETRLPMELSLPLAQPTHFVGRVASRHVEPKGMESVYMIGIEFLNLTEEGKSILAKFIDHCAAVNRSAPTEPSPLRIAHRDQASAMAVRIKG